MRILLWYWGRRGGGAHFSLCLARALAQRSAGMALSVSRQGDLIDAFRALPVPRQEVDTYVDLLGFATGFLRVRSLTRGLVAFAHEQKVDVVVSAMAHLWTPLVAPALARAGIAYVPVVHDSVQHPGDGDTFWEWRLRRELGATRAAVALSDCVAAAIAARRPGLPVIRLPLGALAPSGIAGAIGTAKTSDVLFFGRIRAYKGLDLLRDAWRLVVAAHPGATLRVVGQGDIARAAPGLGDLPGVTLEPRWVADEEMAPLLASARAVVFPYRQASQSGIVPLALSLGVPAVATAVGGLVEQVRDGVSGLVVPPDAAALAAGLLRILDPATRARLAAGASAEGARLADWNSPATALQDALDRLLGTAAAPARP
ncbi:glycosyltransferase family 4 protein [Roseomonas sp. CECT 9278]|uniref:glycosyltransferase family 4 protein n=1 Tax=Roseomonas sp. CECT 9278 TaxID=2845823 RepID=UPI001E3CA6E5|nr:glycosyltransferase [Roseomonas sp. CECT 9278]